MKRKAFQIFIFPTVLVAWVFLEKPVRAFNDAYRPACQWIRLIGRVEGYEEWDGKGPPLLLYVNYQLSGEKLLVPLLIGYPLKKRDFSLVLSGFNEEIDGVRFLSPGFGFNEPITFQYYATSVNRRWRSGAKTVEYRPERVKLAGQVRCQTKLELEPIVLGMR